MDGEVTRVLKAIDAGDASASASLLPLVYEELRTLASAKVARERAGLSIDATGLVHEAYLRLVGPGDAEDPAKDGDWDSRARFFNPAAEAMLEGHAILTAALGDGHEQTRRVVGDLADLYDEWLTAKPDAGHDAAAAE